ncbi:MAG: ferritin family protein [FCB group bacterium]|jgi:rubrerythrin
MKGFSIRNVLEIAIKAEDLGITFYSELAHKFSANNVLRQVIELLAKDEVLHKRQFTDMLNLLKGDYRASDIDIQFLDDVDISAYFKGMQAVDTSLKPSEILMKAFEFEKATVLYYLGIRDIIGSSTDLNEIIRIEKAHITQIYKYLSEIKNGGTISDTWG